MSEVTEEPPQTSQVAAPDADDLLAQLAGEDIDRLLAEADEGGSPVGSDAEPIAPSVAENPPPTVVAKSVVPADEAVDATSDLSKELDALIAEESAAVLAETAAAAEAPAKIAPEPQSPVLKEEHPAEHPSPEPTGVLASSAEEGPSPWYIRLLEFLNSPLDAFPDSLRDAIGYIAVATLANSIGMIVYVRYFRH